ncbi:MAG: hypothetical protein ACQCN4_11455 [Candidatus Bathyarchaeia archaeon]
MVKYDKRRLLEKVALDFLRGDFKIRIDVEQGVVFYDYPQEGDIP